MEWFGALKEWNKGKSKWCIPRRGTEEWVEVRKIMNPDFDPKQLRDRRPKIIKAKDVKMKGKAQEEEKKEEAPQEAPKRKKPVIKSFPQEEAPKRKKPVIKSFPQEEKKEEKKELNNFEKKEVERVKEGQKYRGVTQKELLMKNRMELRGILRSLDIPRKIKSDTVATYANQIVEWVKERLPQLEEKYRDYL